MACGAREDYFIVNNRAEAIAFAVKIAKAGDAVIVTGKGHERSMCFGTTEYPWSDQDAVIGALQAKRLGLSLNCHFELFLREISRQKPRFLTAFEMTSESPGDKTQEANE